MNRIDYPATGRPRLLCSLLLALLTIPGTVAQEPANSHTKAEIERIVKEYILQHPEVLLESVRSMQERDRAAQQQKAKGALSSRQSELLRDPTSPATKPAAADQLSIVEFFDYRCGFCKRVDPTLMKVLADNPNVRLVFKEFPILGPESVLASKAALAAQKQGKYLKFHQALMDSTAAVNAATIEQVGKDIGLDMTKMKADMDAPDVAAAIAKNTELATALDVSSTPTFVVGSDVVAGAMDAAALQKLISKAQAERGTAK